MLLCNCAVITAMLGVDLEALKASMQLTACIDWAKT